MPEKPQKVRKGSEADRLKPLSLHPLTLDEALRGAMETEPPDEPLRSNGNGKASPNGRAKGKRKSRRQ